MQAFVVINSAVCFLLPFLFTVYASELVFNRKVRKALKLKTIEAKRRSRKQFEVLNDL